MKSDVLEVGAPGPFVPVASPWHTALVLAVMGAQVFRGYLHMDQMRLLASANRPGFYTRTILSEWLMLALVLAGVWLKGTSLLTVLGDRWNSGRQFLRDVGIGLVFLMVTIMITSILGSHGRPDDKSVQFLLPQGGVETALWIVVAVSAGICEEAVYRGYLQKQFIALTRNVPAGIVLSALAFGLAHSYQGFAKASLIALGGAMSGILAYWIRSVRPGMIAHTVQDVLGAFIRH